MTSSFWLWLLRTAVFMGWAIAMGRDDSSLLKLAAMVVSVLAVLHMLFPRRQAST